MNKRFVYENIYNVKKIFFKNDINSLYNNNIIKKK